MVDNNLVKFLGTLIEPRKELSGNSICPYLEKYSNYVRYAHVNSVKEIIDNNPIIVEEMQQHEGSTFIYVIEPDITYDEIVSLYKAEQEKYESKDIEILFMIKGDRSVPPLKGIGNYSYDHNSLFVLQRKSTLSKARNDLVKNTNYYKHWSRK